MWHKVATEDFWAMASQSNADESISRVNIGGFFRPLSFF
jgi:hypothetical protein